jgi:putative transposase
MPFWRLYYHLVWSTKNRLPLLDDSCEQKLFPYLIQKSYDLDCKLLAVNGCLDHLHLVISIPPKLAVAEVVKMLKGASSHDLAGLAWQRGYGALTVGERQKSIALDYVKNQKEHHRQGTANPWLERYNEEDEIQPTESGEITRAGKAIREDRADYEAMGDIPF